MEDFTFGMANRRLGIFIDQIEGDEPMEKVRFNKYRRKKYGLIREVFKAILKAER